MMKDIEMNPKIIGFQSLADNMKLSETGFMGHIPDAWRQGRTAYGGMTAGLSLVAAQKTLGDLPPLRSASINFIGPVTADPTFTTRLLRQGRNVTSADVVASVGNNIVATTTFIFGAPRSSELTIAFPAPKTPRPEDCEPFTPEAARSFVPGFFNQFDTRLIAGGRPMSGASKGYIRVWSRHADPDSRKGIASLLTLADVLPPAAMPLFTKMGPVSSVNFLLNFLVDEPKTADGWWHVETRLTAASGGYSSQVMRFWNTDGVLVAEGMQCVAIFI